MLACLVALGAALVGGVTHAQLPPVTTPTVTTPTTTTSTTTTPTTTTPVTTPTTTTTTPADPPADLGVNELGLGVTTPVGALAPLGPGETAQASGVLSVSSTLSGWSLAVSDTTAGSPAPGHLLRAGACDTGAPRLQQALTVLAAPAPGVSLGRKDIGGSAVVLATGVPGSAAVTVSFRQSIGTDEALVTGCAYALRVTFTLS
jgi:hypothetical protein